MLECAQNLACVGAEPLGLTNCLNFGNPEKPAAAWQLDRAVSGLADACDGARRPGRRRQRLPLQRGARRADLPDPGGRRWSASCPTRPRSAGNAFAREGDAIGLIGPFEPTLAGSELAKQRGELAMGLPAPERRRGRRRLRDGPRRGPRRPPRLRPRRLRRRPRLALAESAIVGGLGCQVDLQHLRERGCTPEEALFGEGAGGFVVSGERGDAGGARRDPARRGRRRDDRDRRRRPQPHRQPRRRRGRLALARRARR